MNILSNNIKFTPKKGGVTIYIKWMTKDQKEEDLLSKNDKYHAKSRHAVTEPSDLNCSTDDQILPFDESVNEFKHLDDSLRFSNNMDLFESHSPSLKNENESNTPRVIKYVRTENTTRQRSSSNNSDSEAGFLKIQISDSGCGIASKDIGKPFQMFTQTSEGARPMYNGTGLGLWICKQLCQKMGGDIKVYSELNKGSTFVFYIPINVDKMQNAVIRSNDRADSKLNVLVVDDYSFNRDLHKVLLEGEGADVVVACNGKEALSAYKAKGEGYFDFIMMDVRMPEVDGFEATSNIRKWEQKYKRRMTDIYLVSGNYHNDKEIMRIFREKNGDNNCRISLKRIWSLKKPLDIEMIKNGNR